MEVEIIIKIDGEERERRKTFPNYPYIYNENKTNQIISKHLYRIEKELREL